MNKPEASSWLGALHVGSFALTLAGIAGVYALAAAVVYAWSLPAIPWWLPASVALAIGVGIALSPGAARRRARMHGRP